MDGRLRTDDRVVVAAGPATVDTEAGQFLLITLANLLPRVHRRVDFVLPTDGAIAVRSSSPFSDADTLEEVLLETAGTLDPCGTFRVRDTPPEGNVHGIGVGEAAPTGLPWYVGARGGVARLDRQPAPVEADYGPGTHRGAGLAACLAASAVFQPLHDVPVQPRRLSAWNYGEGEDAAVGPSSLEAVDPGRVLLVGAGAVGSSLAYWLWAWGCEGDWTVVDRDRIELHNTNRSLLFAPSHAGWPDGEARFKADLVADALPRARSVRRWYDEADETRDQTFDVILPLANERNVRSQLAARHATVVLHATTGRNWVSQFHRHVKGVDDCLECRMVDVVPMAADCSEVDLEDQAEPDDDTGDAALPYLSGTSGLMLATALQRLQADELLDGDNDVRWYFNSKRGMAHSGRRAVCNRDCDSIERPALRRVLTGDRRWSELDPAVGE